MKALSEDEKEAHRISEANLREDEFRERTLREGGLHADKTQEVQPCEQ